MGVDDATKGKPVREPLGSASRPCWSTENVDGALNGQVKSEGQAPGVWDRERGCALAQERHLLSLPSASASATRTSILIQRCLC